MKSRILIIEDNYCKFFAAKHVLESQLKMKVDVILARSTQELVTNTTEFNPNVVMYRPAGGVTALLEKMKKRGANRRNSEIVMILADEFDGQLATQVERFVDQLCKGSGSFASAA
jgi:hypothetical protein